jgi:hypothetical protein
MIIAEKMMGEEKEMVEMAKMKRAAPKIDNRS